MNRRIYLLPIFLIVVLGCASYASSLKGGFVLDDQDIIVRNAYIKSGLTLSNILKEDLTPAGKKKYGFYRPVAQLSYRIDYTLWKLNTLGYHLTNMILHILAALALYWLAQAIFQEKLLSLLAAMLFVSHPAHVETVAYISDRADILAALFMLLSLIFYVKQLGDKRPGRDIFLSVSCFVVALLSKENSIILPALLVVYHFAFWKRVRLSAFLPIAILPVVYLTARILFFKSAAIDANSITTIWQRMPAFFAAIPGYIRLLVLPLGLHMDYGNPLFKFTHPRVMAGIILLTAFVVYALRYILKPKRGGALIFFSVSWFFVSLLPVSNIYYLFSYMAEHFLYLPSIGFCLILSEGIKRLYKTDRYRITAMILAVSVVAGYSYLTFGQNDYWRDPAKMYARTLEYNPKSVNAMINLSNFYKNNGDTKGAIDLLKKAIALEPFNGIAFNNIAMIYEEMGQHDTAESLYKKAIGLDLHYVASYNNLGVLYENAGRIEDATALYKRAIDVNPNYAAPYNNLGAIYGNKGRLQEARILYEKAIKVDPDYAEAYDNLSRYYFQKREYKQAIEYCDKAVRRGVVNYELIKALEPYR